MNQSPRQAVSRPLLCSAQRVVGGPPGPADGHVTPDRVQRSRSDCASNKGVSITLLHGRYAFFVGAEYRRYALALRTSRTTRLDLTG